MWGMLYVIYAGGYWEQRSGEDELKWEVGTDESR
jgi:hypothetical protein